MTKSKRMLAMILAAFMATAALAGCGGSKDNDKSQPTTQTSQGTTKAEEKVTFADADDSSELPDWTGKQLKLKVWQAHGAGDAKRSISENDVVSPEIKRITGIEIDVENSFDNSGLTFEEKMLTLGAANDWPHLIYNGTQTKLIDGDQLYELTDLIPKYMPNYMEKYAKPFEKAFKDGYMYTGRHYSVSTNVDPGRANVVYGDIDPERYNYIKASDDPGGNPNGHILVRDDILKQLYPNAKTQKEIEELYIKNGKFTREEILDVPLKSKEDVFKFIYDMDKLIKEKKITEDGRPVKTFFTNSGSPDLWALACFFSGIAYGFSAENNMFTYWDRETNKIEYMFNKDYFKESMLVYNKMVRDGVASPDALIDNDATFKAKLDNGEYAISYAWHVPDKTKLVASNKPYQYRKVYFDIPVNYDKYAIYTGEPLRNLNIGIFKSSVKEEDLPQILNFIDFCVSDVGAKLMCWGPRSAGLWEETDGKRVFKDKEVEAAIINNSGNGKDLYYNICGKLNTGSESTPAWPGFPICVASGGKFNANYQYDRVARNAGDAENFFNLGLYDPPKKTVLGKDWNLWVFIEFVPGAQKFWDIRNTTFNPALTKVLTAKNDTEFEALYSKMLEVASNNGLDDKALEEINKHYAEVANKGYMDVLLKK